jgi:hypothetical protein
MRSERDGAMALANKILDNASRDPDDDLGVLSRQFLRECERSAFWERRYRAACILCLAAGVIMLAAVAVAAWSAHVSRSNARAAIDLASDWREIAQGFQAASEGWATMAIEQANEAIACKAMINKGRQASYEQR